MEPQNPSSKKTGIAIGIIAVLVVALVAIHMDKKGTDTAAMPADTSSAVPVPTDTTPASQTPADTTKPTASEYKDGTYTATGTYMSPGGPDQVAVTLTLKNDVITDVTATPAAHDPMSARYQAQFVSGYKALVVGKKIDDVMLGKVSGSSLTSEGFNAALAQIKTQAKA